MRMKSASRIITRDPNWFGPTVSPGEMLLEEFLKPMGLAQGIAAKKLGVSLNRLNEIVLGKRGITADTALRLARFFGTDAQSWLNLQSHYDVQCAEDAVGRAIKRIRPWRAVHEQTGA